MVHLYSNLNDRPSHTSHPAGLLCQTDVAPSRRAELLFCPFLFHNAFSPRKCHCLGGTARECMRHLPLVTRDCRYPRALHEERLAGVTLEHHVATIALEA